VPVVKIAEGDLARYVGAVWDVGGTDLLLTAGASPFRRVNGRIEPLANEPVLDEATVERLVLSVMTPTQQATFDRDLELDFTLGFAGRARLRANAYRQRGAAALALRIIPEQIPTFDELGLPPVVRELAKLPQGLVLFTGPTGSGKSTSLAALINSINATRPCHILTIEDPIEYLHRHQVAAVSQREIGTDTLTFERALRAALREDPDVLLVGEMRDPESISMALTLAETGHLVFSTLHTNDTAQALDRIIDAFPSDGRDQIRLQVSASLVAVVGQRLLPKRGGGIVAAFEVLIGTHAVRNLIREGKTRQLRNSLTTGQEHGMQTLEMGLTRLVAAGVVDHDVAVARAIFPSEVFTS
jgi:twitching motility protein PilT